MVGVCTKLFATDKRAAAAAKKEHHKQIAMFS